MFMCNICSKLPELPKSKPSFMFSQFKLFIFITPINELVLFVTLAGDFTVLNKLCIKNFALLGVVHCLARN